MPKAMMAALLGLAMAAAPILESGARADMQVPVTRGSLRDDERAAIIDRLLDPPVSGRSLLHELTMQPLELDAKFELWMRGLETAWIADAADGYADSPPPGSERQEQLRSFRFFARDHWDLRSVPQLDTIFPRAELYREIERQFIPSGRIAMPELNGELMFIELSHSYYCGSAGCQSPMLLKRGSEIRIVGEYQPLHARSGHGCAIVLAERTNGVHDLLELGDPEGFFHHRWDGRNYEREQLASRPTTTCCADNIDPSGATRCPQR